MKKRIVCLVFVALLFFAHTVFADDVNGHGLVDATRLNVRGEPNEKAQIIGTLNNGSRVSVVTKTGDWYKIIFGGKTGFVHSDYLRVTRKGEAEIITKPQSMEGEQKAQEAVDLAMEFLGTPYVWGGSSPEGFDCSGLVYYVYGELGVGLYRVAADQSRNGIPVSLKSLKAGDLVFFQNRQYYSDINHVGIYVGDGEFIHAPQTGDVVKISALDEGYYATNLVCARRIFE